MKILLLMFISVPLFLCDDLFPYSTGELYDTNSAQRNYEGTCDFALVVASPLYKYIDKSFLNTPIHVYIFLQSPV